MNGVAASCPAVWYSRSQVNPFRPPGPVLLFRFAPTRLVGVDIERALPPVSDTVVAAWVPGLGQIPAIVTDFWSQKVKVGHP